MFLPSLSWDCGVMPGETAGEKPAARIERVNGSLLTAYDKHFLSVSQNLKCRIVDFSGLYLIWILVY